MTATKEQLQAAGLSLKPLVWTREASRELILGYRAQSPFGGYYVEDMGSYRTSDRYWLQQDDVLSTFATVDEAQSAAQADYERRILASIEYALKPSPALAVEMKRYSLHQMPATGLHFMLERSDGDWVKYADAQAAISAEVGLTREYAEALKTAGKTAQHNIARAEAAEALIPKNPISQSEEKGE